MNVNFEPVWCELIDIGGYPLPTKYGSICGAVSERVMPASPARRCHLLSRGLLYLMFSFLSSLGPTKGPFYRMSMPICLIPAISNADDAATPDFTRKPTW